MNYEREFKNIENNGNKIKDWYRSWVNKARNDTNAKNILHKNSFRPREELYNIKIDKWCTTNLINKEEYKKIVKELRSELLNWMNECGDKGKETELNALNYQYVKHKNIQKN